MPLIRRSLVTLLLFMLAVPRVRGFLVAARPIFAKASSTGIDHYSPVCLRASSASQPSDINGDREKDEPRTGWTHSTPSESSSFWSPGTEKDLATSQQVQQPTADNPCRTGWLHNTVPQSEQKKAEKKSVEGSVSPARQRLEFAMAQQERNHRIISPPAFHAAGEGQAMVVTEHKISMPIYRVENKPTPRLDVYFTIVEKVKSEESRKWFEKLTAMTPQERADEYVKNANLTDADTMACYLQGGPGFGAPTPVAGIGLVSDSSWIAKALGTDSISRVVLMDQRGTGRSTPITKQTLQKRFPDLFVLDEEAADYPRSKSLSDFASAPPEKVEQVKKAVKETAYYLAQFRADNIVRDCEAIREALLQPAKSGDESRPWKCCLGQSFGGFCLMSYLSLVKRPPQVCLFTGGIAPMLTPTYDVYRMLWDRVKERSIRYYEDYPGDKSAVKKIIRQLCDDRPAKLPSGGILTARRFLQLGMSLGSTPSSFASMHELVSSAFVQSDTDDLEFSRQFLTRIDSTQSFDHHPIYYWLHEACYANSADMSPTNWAAHTAYEDKVKSSPEFDYQQTSRNGSDDVPTLFFGEMIFPWMTDDYAELRGLGLSTLVDELATKSDWGPLYDAKEMRQVLSDGRSRAAAAIYFDDLYVEFEACMKVTARGGPLEKCKVWVTNEYQHSGLRDDGAKIFGKLYGMATGSVRIPS